MSFTKKNVYLPLPDVQRGRGFVLNGDPKGKTFLYAHGKSIIVRDINNPLLGYVYSEHAHPTTVAKYAPSGFYIASADDHGKVRIWDTTNEEHILKYEYQPLSGAIKDLDWTEDSKRIAVCGEGRDSFANAFLWDSGSSVGSVNGHSKAVNQISIKQTRPFRLATASEDTDVGFFSGYPFKWEHFNKEHGNFVNAVRYSPDGNRFVSGGSDGKCFIFDGKEGKPMGELGAGSGLEHKGGVYAVSWGNNAQLITASADKTVKLWDVEANKCVTTFTFGDEIEHQQYGCLWQGEHLLSVGLNGFITYLDRNTPDKPLRVIKGHTKAITALAVDTDKGAFYAGSFDGRVSSYSFETGNAEIYGSLPTNGITSLAVQNNQLVTAAMDDTVSYTESGSAALSAETKSKLDSQPRDVAVRADGLSVVACLKEILVHRDGKKVFTLPVAYEPECVSVSGDNVAVGGKDGKVYIFAIEADTLVARETIEASGPVNDVAFSPDGAWLATADGGRNVFVFDVANGYAKKYQKWKYHTGKVSCVAWSPNSQYVASGSLDTSVIVWSLASEMKRVTIKNAHPLNEVTNVKWLTDNVLASAGSDACVRTWNITHA